MFSLDEVRKIDKLIRVAKFAVFDLNAVEEFSSSSKNVVDP